MEEEKVLGVIPHVGLKKGLFKPESCNLVITNRRVIVAKFSKDIYKKETQERVEETKQEGRGRFKQFLASASTMTTFYKRYLDMEPEDILKETPGTFTIEPSTVIKTQLKEGRRYSDEDGFEQQNPHSLLIVMPKAKLQFNFSGDIRNARNLLSDLFGKI
ncbi:MAG: hypothetical protein U9Q18_02340 [Caldisericota bacterium]|nr:hypothetical protein [Caldisericota bacterium]